MDLSHPILDRAQAAQGDEHDATEAFPLSPEFDTLTHFIEEPSQSVAIQCFPPASTMDKETAPGHLLQGYHGVSDPDSESESDADVELSTTRDLLCKLGLPTQLVEQAIQELGEGSAGDGEEFNRLLDHIFYLKNQQNSGASTSAVQGPRKITNTVEKLVNEFEFSSKAVGRAVELCNTPRFNAEEREIADVVDFLEAHHQELEKDNMPLEYRVGSSHSNPWKWVTDHMAEPEVDHMAPAEVAKKNGKRKIGECLGDPETSMPRPRRVDDITIHKHRGARGFGLPGEQVQPRLLPDDMTGPPYFYFENVASMPNDEWRRIRRHLFDIEPEFVDAMHFSPTRRPRGYIHNLPIQGREKVLPDPPMTIQKLMPQTLQFWPPWDDRTKFNCITTTYGSEFMCKKLDLIDTLEYDNMDLKQKEIMSLCKKWNLVWTAPRIPTPISANEIETCLGFDRDHTRANFNMSARFATLGNSFSVYTVAFHFSVLRKLYPNGIKLLSVFSGIGGAEIALHKLGIKLNVVVSVEIMEAPRRCIQAWWEASKQGGRLDQRYHDVTSLGRKELSELVSEYNGIDLIVGGSPCNNLSLNNRVTCTGLEGKHSSLFFEFSRIVSTVREFMRAGHTDTSKLQGLRM